MQHIYIANSGPNFLYLQTTENNAATKIFHKNLHKDIIEAAVYPN
jgi:hypothetical protein